LISNLSAPEASKATALVMASHAKQELDRLKNILDQIKTLRGNGPVEPMTPLVIIFIDKDGKYVAHKLWKNVSLPEELFKRSENGGEVSYRFHGGGARELIYKREEL
jgi:hypothetical protein